MAKKSSETSAQKMSVIGRKAWNYARDMMDEDAKLPAVQQRVCLAIYNAPGLSQDDVSKRLGMDKSSIAKLVSKLVTNGYVERSTNPSDRRVYQLELTENGIRVTKELIRNIQIWEDKIFSVVKDVDRDAFCKSLDALFEAVEGYENLED